MGVTGPSFARPPRQGGWCENLGVWPRFWPAGPRIPRRSHPNGPKHAANARKPPQIPNGTDPAPKERAPGRPCTISSEKCGIYAKSPYFGSRTSCTYGRTFVVLHRGAGCPPPAPGHPQCAARRRPGVRGERLGGPGVRARAGRSRRRVVGERNLFAVTRAGPTWTNPCCADVLSARSWGRWASFRSKSLPALGQSVSGPSK